MRIQRGAGGILRTIEAYPPNSCGSCYLININWSKMMMYLVIQISMGLFDFGLADHAKRNKEIELFREAHRTLCENNRNKSIQHIKKFEEVKTKILSEIISLTDHGLMEVKIAQLSEHIQEVRILFAVCWK